MRACAYAYAWLAWTHLGLLGCDTAGHKPHDRRAGHVGASAQVVAILLDTRGLRFWKSVTLGWLGGWKQEQAWTCMQSEDAQGAVVLVPCCLERRFDTYFVYNVLLELEAHQYSCCSAISNSAVACCAQHCACVVASS